MKNAITVKDKKPAKSVSIKTGKTSKKPGRSGQGKTRLGSWEKDFDQIKDIWEVAFNALPDLVAIIDTGHNIRKVNIAMAERLGLCASDCIGVKCHKVVHGLDEPPDFCPHSKLLLHGNREAAEVHEDRLGGDFLVTTTPLRNKQGKLLGSVHIARDITKIKRVDADLEKVNLELLKASEVKSRFLANMSHEIRTPLNAIIGMTSLLLDTDMNAEQHDLVETVRSSGDVLLSLINDILDFSKIEAQKMELEYQSFEFRRCIEESLDLNAVKASEKKIELAYLIDDDLPAYFIGDVTRLRQILVNLLSNAIKFTEAGEVVISVKTKHQQNDGYQLQFSVRDTGIGIPAESQHLLFQSFSQIEASTTRRFGGTGLGLAISKRLCELMGGTMWVESAGIPGQGTTFNFTIELQAAPDQVYVTPDVSQVDLTNKKILIVDDNETNRQILVHYTESWKTVATAVDSAQKALDLLHAGQSFDLAILDLLMPGMDGLTLAKEIQSLLQDKTFPMILLYSLGYRDERIKDVNFASYLTKPIKPSPLFNSITAALAGKPIALKKKYSASSDVVDRDLGQRFPLHILVVEDNVVNQKVAFSLLNRIGYRADVAADGKEALDALRRQSYDVILMDGQMPEMDGKEATQRIRQQWPADQQPYIIAMTADALHGAREQYLAAGMNDYISKPIRIEELVRALTESRPLASRKADKSALPVESVPIKSILASSEGINPAVLQEFQDLMGQDGPRMLAELINLYLEDSPTLITQMQQQIGNRDYSGLQRTAHTLKGNSNQIGATKLADFCVRLEQQIKVRHLRNARNLLIQIQREFNRIKTELSKIVR